MDINEILQAEKIKVDTWLQKMKRDKAAYDRALETQRAKAVEDLEKNLADTFAWYERTLETIQAQHEKYARPEAIKHMERLRKIRIGSATKHYESTIAFLEMMYRRRRK